MRTAAALVAAAALSLAAAAAADTTLEAPMALFAKAINAGDMAGSLPAYAGGDIAIIDEVAPHRWVGPTAPAAWAAAFGRYAVAKGQSDGRMTLGPPTRVEVAGDAAYVVRPVHVTFRERGKPLVQDATMTFALRSRAGAWKIAAWSWSAAPPRPGG